MSHVYPTVQFTHCPQHLCIPSLIKAQAERIPDAIAIAAPGRIPLTYSQLWMHINNVVQTLNVMGVGRHDRIALVLPNGPEMAVAFLAVTAGATCAPLNPAYRVNEFDLCLAALHAKALIVQAGMDSLARDVARARGVQLIELSPTPEAEAGLFTLTGEEHVCAGPHEFAQPDDVGLVLYTAGTTSRSKYVPLTHTNLCASAYNIQAALGLVASDRCLNVMPLFHGHGLKGMVLPSLVAGGSIMCTPAFSAVKFFDWMAESQPTWYSAVPTIHQAILARAVLHREIIVGCPLRFIRSTSAFLPPQVLAELEQVFNAPVIESYGSTEASIITCNPLPPRERKSGSVGVAAGSEVAIMGEIGTLLPAGEIGEIVVRGASVMQGYENDLTANRSAFTQGWFRTGDLGYLDADGYLFLRGRLKDLINRGGEKIAPQEVDEVLMGHPAVAQAATFAVPHPRLGEDIAAAVVLHQNALATASDIRQFAAMHLADFKIPRQVLIVDDLPKSPTGKLQRIGLAEKLGLKAPNHTMPPTHARYTAPRTAVEEMLAELWARVLGLECVGIHDDFFQLGGDSILATQLLSRVRDTIHVELSFLCFFETPTVAGMAQCIETANQTMVGLQAPPLQPVPRDGALPLSYAQQRLWFIDQFGLSGHAYNLLKVIRLRGPLHITALAQSLQEIVRRHEILRTTFAHIEGQALQIIGPAVPLLLPVVDLQGLPQGDWETQVHKLACEESQRPFDLGQGPLLRAMLLRLATEEHVLLLTMHHIVSDAWSHDVFWREFAALYRAYTSGSPSPLPELPIQYADFALWQRQWLQGEVLEAQLAYWKQQLGGTLPMLQLPTDWPRPPVQTYRGARYPLELSKNLTEAVKTLSQREGVTLFMTLLAAFKTLLYRYTAQEDILVGFPIAGRTRMELERLIGFFVNTLVFRTDLSGNPTFRNLLGRVREMALGAYAHQDLPFEKLVEALQPERNLSYSPLFQVMFALRNAPRPVLELLGLTVIPLEVDSGTSPFDLTLEIVEKAEGLSCVFTYNDALFNAPTIMRMSGQFQTLLEGIVANPAQRIGTLPLLMDAERHQLLREWNDTTRDDPKHECLHQLFEARVERTPETVAVACEDEKLTYCELNRRANQLAHHLRALGIGPEVLVGICIERSLEMVVGLLGILKAGGAYVPLDPSCPKERLAFMLQDTQVPVVLTQKGLVERLPELGAKVLCLDTEWEAIAQESAQNPGGGAIADNLAYVIYTSGSTGKPKGVLVSHQNVTRLFEATDAWFHFSERDVWTLFHSLAFDFSVWELWGALLYGGRLVVVPYWVSRSPEGFYDLLCTEQVTVLNQTPSAFRQLLSFEDASGTAKALTLRLVIFGGEALELQSLTPWFVRHGDQCPQLVNMYGITETTVHVTYRPLSAADIRSASGSAIGRPIPDLQVYVLDPYLHPVPIGVPGEMYVGGAGVARGYLNRPELTAERFLPNPFASEEGARLYKTGDLARYRPNGDIEYLGRLDHQIKLRGFRIELGEVESMLCQHPGVQEAVVLAREDVPGDKRLVAYLVPDYQHAFTVRQLLGFERKGLLNDQPQYELLNGMVILHKNKNETDFMYKEMFEEQTYWKHGITLNEGDCIFDVGANIGLFTLFVGHMCKNAVIYAFEPIPPIFDVLRINTALYGLNVKLFDCGLSDVTTSRIFTYYPYVSIISGCYADGTQEREIIKSFLRNQERLGASETALPNGALIDEMLAERLTSETFTCQLTTISDVIRENHLERVDLLKIDVEKSEEDVLTGIQEHDWPKIRQLVMEVHDIDDRLARMVTLLQSHGYALHVQQDAVLQDTGLYNIYAVRASKDQGLPSEGRSKHADESRATWHSQHRLVSDVRHFLTEQFPDYMVPAAFVLLDALPLTPNGKVDRHALPAPEDRRPELEVAYVAPRSEVEGIIAAVWQEALRIERVGLYDNFFDLGGHSMLLVQVYSKLQEVFHKDISIVDLFQYPTINALTTYLSQKRSQESSSPHSAEAMEKLSAGKNRLKQLYQRRQRTRENREGAR